MIGLVMLVAALVMASFATHVTHLVFTQGLLYGVGAALLYNPFMIYIEEWFEEQKGLAYSIFWAGTGFSGAVVPFLMEWALYKYGFRTTMRASAVFIVCGTSAYYHMGYLDHGVDSRPRTQTDSGIVHLAVFLSVFPQASYFCPAQKDDSTEKFWLSSQPVILGLPVWQHHRGIGVLYAPSILDKYVCLYLSIF